MNSTEYLKNFAFSETELLENIGENKAHTDEIAMIKESEWSN